jgi:hypothetical protein
MAPLPATSLLIQRDNRLGLLSGHGEGDAIPASRHRLTTCIWHGIEDIEGSNRNKPFRLVGGIGYDIVPRLSVSRDRRTTAFPCSPVERYQISGLILPS